MADTAANLGDSAAAAANAVAVRQDRARQALIKLKPAQIRLCSGNFDQWLNILHSRLNLCNLSGLLLPPTDAAAVSDPVLHELARTAVTDMLETKDYHHVYNCPTIFEAVRSLRITYQGTQRIHQSTAASALFDFEMQAEEDVAGLIGRLEVLERELAVSGLPVPKELLPIRIITAARRVPLYQPICGVLFGSEQALTLETVHQALRAVEQGSMSGAPPAPAAAFATAVAHAAPAAAVGNADCICTCW